MICCVHLTCQVSVRLSQSLPALSEHSVFLYVSHVCIALNIQHIMQKHMGKLWYFLMKNVTLRVLFTEGGTLWKEVPKRCQKSYATSWFLGSLFWCSFVQKSYFRAFVWHPFLADFWHRFYEARGNNLLPVWSRFRRLLKSFCWLFCRCCKSVKLQPI